MIWSGLCFGIVAHPRQKRHLTMEWDNMRWVWVIGLTLACGTVLADAPRAQDCRVSQVVDGDTVHLICRQVRYKLRLLGYDTPEVSRPACAREAAVGAQATKVLQALVASGPVTALRLDGQDRYGRDLGDLAIGGQDVATAMLASGLARRYSGGRRKSWCKD
jgi:micrococcal nuclease